MDRKDAEVMLDRVCKLHFFERRNHLIRDPDYWRSLNPELTVSDHPWRKKEKLYPIGDDVPSTCRKHLLEEGYLQTGPIVPSSDTRRLVRAMDRISAEGYPPLFICVYDEYYQLFAGLTPLVSAIMGEDCLMVPHGLDAFYVDAGRSHAGASPHRDSVGPDPRVSRGELPGVMTFWVALTDSRPDNGCLYAVPAPDDPYFLNPPEGLSVGDSVSLHKIRAIPASEGSVLAWSTHFLHWGGNSTNQARHPRVAATMYFQRRDLPPFHHSAFGLTDDVLFEHRLRWIAWSMNDPYLLTADVKRDP